MPPTHARAHDNQVGEQTRDLRPNGAAAAAEAALVGAELGMDAFRAAALAMADDFTPISDMRASA